MDKIQKFESGTYITNGEMSGIVKCYSADMFYFHNRFPEEGGSIFLYIAFLNADDKHTILKETKTFNDGSFREMNDSEIDEFNQILFKKGYIWDAASMKVIEIKARISTDIQENKTEEMEENTSKFKTGDFLTSIDGDETFIFMRYEEDGWLLGWNIVYGIDECCDKCEVQRFNPAHPWQYSTDYEKQQFLYKLRGTCYVWHDDVKEMRKEYELDDDKLKCGDVIYFRDGETVIFKGITADKLKMRVWHAPTDGNVLTEYNRFIPWKYATANQQDYIRDILKLNGYVWDKDENNFFSHPRMITTNISDNSISIPNEIQPINIPDGYIATIENGKIYFTKKFKDGDFIKTTDDSAIAIFKEISDGGEIIGYAEYFTKSDGFLMAEDVIGHHLNQWTKATDEDIQLFKDKLAEQNYKWDEELKQLVDLCWMPEIGETYYFINRYFKVIKARNINSKAQRKYISLHNCFKTEEDATELLKKLKQMFVNYNKQKYE